MTGTPNDPHSVASPDAQARLERNPDTIAAIQRAERDLRDGRVIDVEVVPAASGSYIDQVGRPVAAEYARVVRTILEGAPLAQVATAEELAALPEGVILRDREGDAWQKDDDGQLMCAGIRATDDAWRESYLPMTVLWLPEVSS